MSHFTHIKTRFQNLFYLEKALNRLNITHNQQEESISNSSSIKLVIPQSNGYDISFCWNGQEYDLVADISFWEVINEITNLFPPLNNVDSFKL